MPFEQYNPQTRVDILKKKRKELSKKLTEKNISERADLSEPAAISLSDDPTQLAKEAARKAGAAELQRSIDTILSPTDPTRAKEAMEIREMTRMNSRNSRESGDAKSKYLRSMSVETGNEFIETNKQLRDSRISDPFNTPEQYRQNVVRDLQLFFDNQYYNE